MAEPLNMQIRSHLFLRNIFARECTAYAVKPANAGRKPVDLGWTHVRAVHSIGYFYSIFKGDIIECTASAVYSKYIAIYHTNCLPADGF